MTRNKPLRRDLGVDWLFGLSIKFIMNVRNSDVNNFFYWKSELTWQA